MRIEAEHERSRDGPDAVTFSFADPATRLYGLARLGLSGEGAQRRGSALAILFSGGSPVVAVAEGDLPVGVDATRDELTLAGITASVDVPLARWSLRMAGEDYGFALAFEAGSPPAGREVPSRSSGYEQLCSVRGEAVLHGEMLPVTGRGQRGHDWSSPDWTSLAELRTVCAWMDDDRGLTMTTARGRGTAGHDEEVRWGALLGPSAAIRCDDPRLSTTYDSDGRQRRAGLELWVHADDEAPHRAAGHVLCGSSLELGQLALDCSFMRWTMEGAEGIGRYDVLRLAS